MSFTEAISESCRGKTKERGEEEYTQLIHRLKLHDASHDRRRGLVSLQLTQPADRERLKKGITDAGYKAQL